MEISGDIPDKRSAPNEAGSPLRARQEGSPAPSICVGDGPTASESSIVITVPQVKPTEEFPAYIEPVVKKVIAEEEEYGSLTYLVRFKDGATSQVSIQYLDQRELVFSLAFHHFRAPLRLCSYPVLVLASIQTLARASKRSRRVGTLSTSTSLSIWI